MRGRCCVCCGTWCGEDGERKSPLEGVNDKKVKGTVGEYGGEAWRVYSTLGFNLGYFEYLLPTPVS